MTPTILRTRPDWWTLVVLACLAGTVGFITAQASDDRARNGGYALVGILLIGWFAAGRQAALRSHHGSSTETISNSGKASGGGWGFLVVLVVCTGVLVAISPSLALLQVIAYPYAWSFSERMREIVLANIAVALAVALGTAWSSGGTRDAWLSGIATAGLSLAFSLIMGLWIQSIAVSAAERGRLRADLDSARAEVTEAYRQAGAATERERFAREIHDTLTQTLTAVVMLAERGRSELDESPERAGETLAYVERTARQALAETRSLIVDGQGIGSPIVSTSGQAAVEDLSTRIRRIAAQFSQETGVASSVHASAGGLTLDRPTEVVLLRCCQEALANVRKHATGATRVEVSLQQDSTSTSLTVVDDGAGFPDEVDAAAARGFGIQGIRSRLALTAGQLDIETNPGGTRLRVVLPRNEAM